MLKFRRQHTSTWECRRFVSNRFQKLKEETKFKIQSGDLTEWNIVDGNKLPKLDIPESQFIVEDLIPEGISVLAGNPSSCKTFLLLEIARCVSSNKDLFGKFPTKETRCLFLDEESPLNEIKRRWSKYDVPPCVLTDFLSLSGFRIDNPMARESLLKVCKEKGYKLLIMDSLRDIHQYEENNSLQVQNLINHFKEFQKEGISLLISHHLRKEVPFGSKEPSQILRGSSALLGGIDCLISLNTIKRSDNLFELFVSQSKLRQGRPISDFRVDLIEENEKMRFEFISDIESEMKKLEKTKTAIRELLQSGEKYQSEIVDALIPYGFAPRTIHRAIKELKENNGIRQRVGKKRRIYLALEE